MPDNKGRFQKGEGGRLKGSQNKATTQLRTNVQKLLEDQYEKIVEDIEFLSPKERIDVWCKLLEYALPKLNRTEIAEPPTDLEQLMTLTPEERQARIIELQSKLQN